MFIVAYSQLSYTHSFNSSELLGNSNCIGIHASSMIIVFYYSFFFWLYRDATSIAAPFCQFYAYLSVFFVRLCFQFLDHCDKLILRIWVVFLSHSLIVNKENSSSNLVLSLFHVLWLMNIFDYVLDILLSNLLYIHAWDSTWIICSLQVKEVHPWKLWREEEQ